jgi:hypothetical protein
MRVMTGTWPSFPEMCFRRAWYWLAVGLLVAGLPVLLHGCHGDEDNELFAPLSWHGHRHGPSDDLGRFGKLPVDHRQ